MSVAALKLAILRLVYSYPIRAFNRRLKSYSTWNVLDFKFWPRKRVKSWSSMSASEPETCCGHPAWLKGAARQFAARVAGVMVEIGTVNPDWPGPGEIGKRF